MKTMLLAILLAVPALAQEGKAPDCVGCKKETYGTSIQWEGTPSEAGAKAKSEQKLLFILHVSGVFEDPAFT
jgi:hypothetical protein